MKKSKNYLKDRRKNKETDHQICQSNSEIKTKNRIVTISIAALREVM